MRSLFYPVGFILCAGLAVLSSVSLRLFYLQLGWIVLGIAVVVLFSKIDWHSILNYNWFIWGLYGVSIGLLVLAYFTAPIVRNTKSWLVFGSFTLQPVEVAKVSLILVYAQYFSRRHLAIGRWTTFIRSFFMFAIPGGLVAIQPDLGSALILFGIWLGFVLVSGLPLKRIAVLFLVLAVIGAVGWNSLLKGYQRERIVGVFYPERNALTVNYSTIQSKIAIGSAGWWGKGYGQGSQTQLGFLSEPATDFILPALIEEWGLVAGTLIVIAFLRLVFVILKVGLASYQNFEKFICLGAAIVFSLHFLCNAGSALGIFPVIGVPFPFLSYGGSNLLTSFSLLAIINAIANRS